MDASRQLGNPQRPSDNSSQLIPLNGQQQQQQQNINSNFSQIHHLPHHMQQQQQLNGPLSRPPSNMTVSQQPSGTLTLQGPNSLQPGTVYLIRSPTGELQLVRLANPPNSQQGLPGGPPVQRPGLSHANPQMQQGLRFPAPAAIMGAPHHAAPRQHLSQPPGGSINQGGAIAVPPGQQGSMQMVNHNNSGHLQMHPSQQQQRPAGAPPSAAPGGPGTTLINDQLNKAKQFFNALLTMTKNQSEDMFRSARTLLQQLVDGEINPDAFAERLQIELKSTPQPILAPLLKACLSKLREGLYRREIVIESINAPPLSALSLPDHSLPQAGAHVALPAHPSHAMPVIVNNTKNLEPSKSTPVHPPRSTTPKAKAAGKAAQKAAAVAATASAAAAASSALADQHPVFAQLPQLAQTHLKPEKAKAPKPPPVEKKLTAKQKKELQLKERRSLLEAEPAPSLSVPPPAKEPKEQKEIKPDEDELNDVAAMGGVNLTEESAKLATADIVGTQTRSIEDHSLIPGESIRKRLSTTAKNLIQDDIPGDVLALISHAVEARIRNYCERLNVIAEHRAESVRGHAHYKQTQDVKQQLKFIEELDRVAALKREEEDKETRERTVKSRNKPDDQEYMLKKQQAKEKQREEESQMLKRKADEAAMAALNPRKKPRPDGPSDGTVAGPSGLNKPETVKSQPLRVRIKRVSLRDVIFMAETDGKMSKSAMLYGLLHQIK
ncbi:putative Transcription initiation factor TFIID subunit 4 [Hypsibius exemplaris]|uniref:Transcription initiation factor TFIID subunit 4 n=1 Tax=Hypsibius exemplaris TaxID=2072580 RepID=A0A1W0WB34_HYPEX|nr:putative Transcription initiation factor TFIID subunit 4 [Hypsibius exemplaris]